MKTIKQIVSLEGQHEDISVSELRSQPGEVFTQVELGKTFSVTKCGNVIAEIKKPEEFDWRALSVLRKISTHE